MLAIEGLCSSYGRVEALHGASLHVERNEIVALIGANGAGKTTLLMTICGQVKTDSGYITFEGHNLVGMSTHHIVRLGIAHAPEGRRIFPRMTVFENLQLGATLTDHAHFNTEIDHVFDLFPRLKERMHQYGGTLSGGEQQMLAIARSLMARPKLLLLDEPSLGLAPIMVKRILAAIERINKEGTTILLVEQNANQALEIASRGYVMVNGTITLSDTGEALRGNPHVRAAYLEGSLDPVNERL